MLLRVDCHNAMSESTDTRADAYRTIRDAGEDVSLRRQVAHAIATSGPMTTHELGQQFPERSLNALRPRVNELVRMGCLERDGTRTNPSGHDAYVHHLTDQGRAYLRGEIDPEPDPPLAELRRMVVKAARDHVNGDIDTAMLAAVVERHDTMQRRMDPEGC